MEIVVYLPKFLPLGSIRMVPHLRKRTRLTSGRGIRIVQSGGYCREICLRRVVRDLNRRVHGLARIIHIEVNNLPSGLPSLEQAVGAASRNLPVRPSPHLQAHYSRTECLRE
jgi:hypothetical protein